MPKKIQRDAKKAVKHAKDMPKFGEIVQSKRGVVPVLGGGRIELIWDYSEKASEEQIFMLRVNCSKHDHSIYLPIAKQAWEHVSRAI